MRFSTCPWTIITVVALGLGGCAPQGSASTEAPTPPPSDRPSAPAPTPSRSGSPEPTASASESGATTPHPSPRASDDPRWRFFAREQRPVTSPWFDGSHRTMIDFGCSRAPYYDPDPRCPGRQGFHHGVDVALPCGVPLRAGVEGTVVLGGLGSAYGAKAFRIRTSDRDVVLGHVEKVLVRHGQRVEVGDVVAHNGDLGAPDGCHLHLEVRPRGGSVSQAVDPASVARLRPVG